MTQKELLCDVLREFLDKTDTGTTRLANLSKVPLKTLNHWLSGHVVRPRRWQDVVQIALVLHLDERQADRMLLAAGHKRTQKLRAMANKDDLALLEQIAGLAPSLKSTKAPFLAPPDLPTFVGREREISTLRQALLSNGQVVIYGVRGMGGVGKSILATRLAYQTRDDFPDGVLWARLDVSDTLTILAAFADAYGKDVSQFRDVESRAGAVRDLFANKRALVVLDNAENSKQVKPLLPPSNCQCAVLVTTRVDMDSTDGWPFLMLNGFADDGIESLQLFERFIGQKQVARQRVVLLEIANLLGHLPLALAIAGGQLSHAFKTSAFNNEATLANNLLAELRNEHARLDRLQRDTANVRASFNLSYRKFQPDLQQKFAALGVFGGADFSVNAVASVWDTPTHETTSRLHALMSHSIVQPSHDGRFRMHPLLRDFARELMIYTFAKEERVRTGNRMVNYFVSAIHANSLHDALLPEADYSNVWEALRTVIQMPWADTSARHTDVLYGFLQQRDAAAKVEPHLRNAIEQAQNAGDIDGSLLLQRRMIYLLWWRGDDPSEAAEQLLDLALKNDNPTAFEALRLLGMFARLRGDYAASTEYYERSLALARHTNQPGSIIQALVGLGGLHRTLEEYDIAEKLFTEAEQLISADIDFRLHVLIRQQMGLLRSSQGCSDEAAQLLDEAILLSRQNGRDDLLLGALGDRADIALQQGMLDNAWICSSESLEISRRMGFAHGVSDSLERLGKCALLQGDWAKSRAMFSDALDTATAANIIECKASINFGLAELSLATGDKSAARDYAQTSLTLYENSHPLQSTKIRRWLSKLL